MKGQARHQGDTAEPCPRQMPVPPSEMTKNKKIDAFTRRSWSEIVRRRCDSFAYWLLPSAMLCYY